MNHNYSPDVKDVLTAVSIRDTDNNLTLKNVVDSFSKMGYPVPLNTLKKWRRNYRRRGHVESITKSSGHPALLDDVEMDIFSGFILHEEEKGHFLSQEDLAKFILEELGHECVPYTAGNYAMKLGFQVGDFKTQNSVK